MKRCPRGRGLGVETVGTLQAGPGGGSAETGARGDHDILLARIGVATPGSRPAADPIRLPADLRARQAGIRRASPRPAQATWVALSALLGTARRWPLSWRPALGSHCQALSGVCHFILSSLGPFAVSVLYLPCSSLLPRLGTKPVSSSLLHR